MDATVNPRSQLVMNAETALRSDLPPAGALPAGTRLHEFNLLATLGEGGFSIVYAAHDTQLHRDVAIKEYMPAAFASRVDGTQVKLRSERHRATFEAGLRSFIDEARLLAQFKHRALVEVLRFWEENGTAYMAMPRYSGRTMRHVLKEYDVQCDERWLRSIFAPILDVLELLHTHNIFHRDIAPDNILIQDDGMPVLLDLGSARRVLGDMQHALTVVVKPGYAPIEQYAEDLAVPQGPWTDIYAVGAVLYYAVTGNAPVASVSRMMKDTLEPLSGTPRPGFSREFLAAIDHTLALQPGARPQSIAALRALLGMNTVTWTATPLGSMNQKAAATAPQHIDEAKTVILSSEEMAQLASRFINLDKPSSRDTTVAQPRIELPDPFLDQKKAQAPSSNSFPEMEEMLAGDRSHKAGHVAVPGAQKSAPQTPTAAEATQAKPIPPAKKESSSKAMWLGLTAIAALAAIGAGGWLMLRPSQPEATSVETVQPDTLKPAAEAPKQAEPAIRAPVETASTSRTEAAGASDPAPRQPLVEAAPTLAPATPPVSPMSEGLNVEDAPRISLDSTREAPAQTPSADSAPKATQSEAASAPNAATPGSQASPTPNARSETPAREAVAPVKKTEKPKATPAVVATATLALNVKPWGEVWVDGQQRGVSPPIKTLDLEPGTHTIELRNPGLPAWSKRLTVKEGTPLTLEHDFKAPAAGSVRTAEAAKETPREAAPKPVAKPASVPAAEQKPAPVKPSQPTRDNAPRASLGEVSKGVVAFSIHPWGEIWIDGQKRGVSPPLHDLRLPEGTYSVELRNPSFPSFKQKISVGADQRLNLEHRFE
ncbi:serine/threonine protein kinase [Pseudomonas sp. RIT-PI-AD]|uniref:serine/threonine-protein kinase n=1 Tax=Pseudomonas sp. RIT-PI-AD TaxID=3035294 RepID=UPI0021D8EC93|nr:serine/threonine protein kinase [Pseudomonas sp. RIT-PI-AD]